MSLWCLLKPEGLWYWSISIIMKCSKVMEKHKVINYNENLYRIQCVRRGNAEVWGILSDGRYYKNVVILRKMGGDGTHVMAKRSYMLRYSVCNVNVSWWLNGNVNHYLFKSVHRLWTMMYTIYFDCLQDCPSVLNCCCHHALNSARWRIIVW